MPNVMSPALGINGGNSLDNKELESKDLGYMDICMPKTMIFKVASLAHQQAISTSDMIYVLLRKALEEKGS